MSKVKNTVVVNFNDIENAVAAGQRVTTKDLAKAYMVSPVTMRGLLENHFGPRIGFKRGRTGGIVLDGVVAAADAPADVAAVAE
jgi:hypothetical protein